MSIEQPTVRPGHVVAPSYDELVNTLELIRHATALTPDGGGHHEAANDLAEAMLKRVEAGRVFVAADMYAEELSDSKEDRRRIHELDSMVADYPLYKPDRRAVAASPELLRITRSSGSEKIKIWQVHGDGGERGEGPVVGYGRTEERAAVLARGQGWYGGQGRVKECPALVDSEGRVWALANPDPVDLHASDAKYTKMVTDAADAALASALDGLSPEKLKVLRAHFRSTEDPV